MYAGFLVLRPLLAVTAAVWLRAALLLGAGAAGAIYDELDHRGLSLWLARCAGGQLSLPEALALQLQQMPVAALAMSLALAGSIAWLIGHRDLRRWLLGCSGYLACIGAMLVSIALCPAVLELLERPDERLAGMVGLELALAFTAALALALAGMLTMRLIASLTPAVAAR